MTLGAKIRAARKAKKLTQKELASLIGAAHNSISNWENDQNKPDPDTIENLCWALGVSPNYFFGVKATESNNERSELLSLPGIMPIGKGTRIPLYGRIACGTPVQAIEDLEETAWLPDGIKADFALTCVGDSMINARIFDGDIVYIKAQSMVDNGQIAAVAVNGDEMTLKRVYYRPEIGELVLRPENPMHQIQVYRDEELEQVRILGRAVHFLSKVK